MSQNGADTPAAETIAAPPVAIQAAAAPTKARTPGQQIRDLRSIQERYITNPGMPIGPEP